MAARTNKKTPARKGATKRANRKSAKKNVNRKSAKSCRSLAEIRDQIDRIDRALMKLMAERSGFVRRAAQLKLRREDVFDPARINDVIAHAKREAKKLGLDPKAAEQAFRAMVERFIAYEFREFDRRKGGAGRQIQNKAGAGRQNQKK